VTDPVVKGEDKSIPALRRSVPPQRARWDARIHSPRSADMELLPIVH
jgi:hypothetical protein